MYSLGHCSTDTIHYNMINVTPFWNKFLDNAESLFFKLLTFFGPIETNGNFEWGEFGKIQKFNM